jgi:hypothetical protein
MREWELDCRASEYGNCRKNLCMFNIGVQSVCVCVSAVFFLQQCGWFVCLKILTRKLSEENRKTGHLLCKTQNLNVASM